MSKIDEVKEDLVAKAKLVEKARQDYLNEKVPVMLLKPEGEKGTTSFSVTINGRTWQVQYGKQVLLPRYVANVVEESQKNEMAARERADEMEEKSQIL